tara:strand:+ start:2060 stop:4102 length:2043 start_codon:yes stop_codon:yes gene_type:complete
MQSKLVLAITLIGFISSYSLYLLTDKTYQIKSVLQISSPQSNVGNVNDQLNFVLGSSNISDIDNIESLYLSRNNLMDSIEILGLNFTISGLAENDAIQLSNTSYSNIFEEKPLNFVIKIIDDAFELVDENNNAISPLLKEGDSFANENISFDVDKISISNSSTAKLTVSNLSDQVGHLRKLLNVSLVDSRYGYFRNTGLVDVSLVSSDIENGKRIIDTTNRVFIENNIKTESEKARRAINFIDQRIDSINFVLSQNKDNLKQFQEDNKSVNIDLEINSIISAISEIDQRINLLNLEITEAENTYTPNNPIFLSLLNKKEELISQRKFIENKIEDLPLAQQQYIDLFREVEISQTLYSQLMDRRLSFSIMEASTIGNIRVLDAAYKSIFVGPRLRNVIFTIVIFFGIGLFIAIIRGMFFLAISNPAELQDQNIHIPYFSIVPSHKEDDITSESSEKFKQSLESAVLNIMDQDSSKKIILITSSTAENGKSMLAGEIAKKFAELGKKTALLDLDLKRGDLHKKFNTERITKKDFLNINSENIDKYKITENLFFISKPRKLIGTFEFLYSPEFSEKVNFIRDHFDIVILDTAPALSVTDTSLLMSFSDINVFVVRHEHNTISEIKQTLSVIEQSGHKVDGLVYNDYAKPKGYYGYYGLYGNYAYSYYAQKYLYTSYDYTENED